MRHFRLIDNLMGWLTFAIAAYVYCSTVEPTASFWDFPEFITTAYKLEVGHPPGAPFFMLTANLFTQFVSAAGCCHTVPAGSGGLATAFPDRHYLRHRIAGARICTPSR